jgi:integral membrane protein
MVAKAVGRLRVISLLEGVSFLILLTCSVIKRTADNATGVHIMGPVHAVFFILYVILALDVRGKLNWDGATTAKVLVASAIPFAPFFVERWLRTQENAAPAPARAKT